MAALPFPNSENALEITLKRQWIRRIMFLVPCQRLQKTDACGGPFLYPLASPAFPSVNCQIHQPRYRRSCFFNIVFLFSNRLLKGIVALVIAHHTIRKNTALTNACTIYPLRKGLIRAQLLGCQPRPMNLIAPASYSGGASGPARQRGRQFLFCKKYPDTCETRT